MRKEYDLKKLKVKRKGILPDLQEESERRNKVRITIALDKDIIEFFKEEAKHPGAFPYQTQINHALRQAIQDWQPSTTEDMNALKKSLMHDRKFICRIAEEVKHYGKK